MPSKQVQRRRGTTAEHTTFVGANGEVTVDITKKVEVVHDGSTPGGFPQASEKSVTDTNARIDTTNANVTATNARIDTTNANVTAVTTRVSTLESTSSTHTSQITELQKPPVSSNLTVNAGALAVPAAPGEYVIPLVQDITAITLPAGQAGRGLDLWLRFVQDSVGGRAVGGWPAGVVWEGGSTPVINRTPNAPTTLHLQNLNNQGWTGGVAGGSGAGDSSPLGAILPWPSRATLPAGYIALDGQELDRATYPDFVTLLDADAFPTASEVNWQGVSANRGCFVKTSSTGKFRLPDWNGKASGTWGGMIARGDGALSAGAPGQMQIDVMQGHYHAPVDPAVSGASQPIYRGTGGSNNAFTGLGAGTTGGVSGSTGAPSWDGVNGTPRIGNETRMRNVTVCWVIKLFGTVSNPGAIDVTQLASQVAGLLARNGSAGDQGLRNRALNGDFRVAQRGIGPYAGTSGGTWTFDRWRLYGIGSTNTQVSRVHFASLAGLESVVRGEYVTSVAGTLTSAASGLVAYQQSIEGVTIFRPGKIVLSFVAWRTAGSILGCRIQLNFGGGGSPTQVIGAKKITITASPAKYSVEFDVPSVTGKTLGSNNSLVISFDKELGSDSEVATGYGVGQAWSQTGDLGLGDVQLEEGTVATPFEYRPMSYELARCQKYLQTGTFDVTQYTGATGALLVAQVDYKVPMWANPTVTLSNITSSAGTVSVFNSSRFDSFSVAFNASGVGHNRWSGNYLADTGL